MRFGLQVFAVCFCVLALAGCKDDVFETVGAGASDSHFTSMAQSVNGSPAALKKASFASDHVRSAPPSNMVLDRSKFNDRRIAETHNLQVETEAADLKARYDRDFQKCLALGCEITTSNAQTRRTAYINALLKPEVLGE